MDDPPGECTVLFLICWLQSIRRVAEQAIGPEWASSPAVIAGCLQGEIDLKPLWRAAPAFELSPWAGRAHID
jgi:hypothetical protein